MTAGTTDFEDVCAAGMDGAGASDCDDDEVDTGGGTTAGAARELLEVVGSAGGGTTAAAAVLEVVVSAAELVVEADECVGAAEPVDPDGIAGAGPPRMFPSVVDELVAAA